MEKVAIYYRVSTERQDIKSQEHAIDLWFRDNGVPGCRIKVFKDEGISGATMNRPALQTMLAEMRDGKLDTLICYRLDRISRDASTAIRLLLELDDIGIKFYSVTQPVLNYRDGNPFHRTMLAAFAEIAQIERETIAERVKFGLRAAKERGVRLGPPIKITDETRKKAKSMRNHGFSIRKIAKCLQISVGSAHSVVSSFDD